MAKYVFGALSVLDCSNALFCYIVLWARALVCIYIYIPGIYIMHSDLIIFCSSANKDNIISIKV